MPGGDGPGRRRGRRAMPPAGCGMPSRSHSALNCSRSSARSIDAGLVPSTGMPGGLERVRELQRRLAAEAHDHAGERLAVATERVADVAHALDGERLEEQPVAGVVVGRDGLGVAVDHHGLEARVREGERRVHAAVVELDTLADAVRPAAEDDDRRARRAGRPRPRPRRCRSGRACSAANSAAHVSTVLKVTATPAARRASRTASRSCPTGTRAGRRRSRGASHRRQSRAGSGRRPDTAASSARASLICAIWSRNHGSIAVASCSRSTSTPRRSAASSRNSRSGVGGPRTGARARRSSDGVVLALGRVAVQPEPAGLEAAARLLHRLGERPADGHDLADRLHLRAEHARRARAASRTPSAGSS